MDNKDVNITFKLNTNLILVVVCISFLIGTIFFCAFYNLPIFKKLRELLKRELVDSKVEPFSMPSMKDMMDAPKEFVKDINDVICNKSGDEKKEKIKTKPVLKKPVVEGFFTNVRPN
tara:strand:+ start:550 stop:900 length:351 start_codon:yes stop_codon:yes gene_type:complete